MKYVNIDIDLLDQNNGQVEGLPLNPRKWNKSDIDRLAKSIKETPELLEARGIIAYHHEGRYVVLGGNMRLEACRKLKYKQVPCIVLPESTSRAKMKEIVIKDNGAFGAWDESALENDWADLPLGDWGCDIEFGGKEEKAVNPDYKTYYQVVIDCNSEQEQEKTYNEIKDKYECHILTL